MWIACVDVGYSDSQARAACVVIRDWTDPAPAEEHVAIVDGVEDYQPGEFFVASCLVFKPCWEKLTTTSTVS